MFKKLNPLTCPYCNITRNYEIQELKDKEKEYGIKCIACKKEFKYKRGYKKLYLSRTFSVSDSKYKYANHVITDFSGLLQIVDPMDWNYDESMIDNHEKIVEEDIKRVQECDCLTAFIMGFHTFGTILELSYAHRNNIPTYIINPVRNLANDPWAKYHSIKIYEDVDKCYTDIIAGYLKELNSL